MTVINPPGWLQNAGSTHTAEQMRNFVYLPSDQKVTSTLIPKSAVDPGKGSKLKVTQTGSPSMGVIVGSGHAKIGGTESSKQGAYGVMNDADLTLTVTAAHGSLNRIDLVVFKVEDSQYSGANNTSSLVMVDGTPASSPVAPTAPANSIVLAEVLVSAGVSTIVNANITDQRRFAGTGIIPVNASGDLPAAGQAGRYRDRLDTGILERDNGSAWVQVVPAAPATVTMNVYTANNTWTKPANAKTVRIRVQAGGGGGGGAASAAAGEHTKGGGGGGGGYSESVLAASSLGATVAVTVGGGGAGGSAGANGSTGGTSSFFTHVVSAGGNGGGFAGTSPGVFTALGGAGGGASAGQITTVGGVGHMGTGGGNLGSGGPGGHAHLGGGAIGTRTLTAPDGINGVAAGLYGGGGGGACVSSTGTGKVGGAGGAGIVIVETWF